jgi:hypothetical protein
VLVGFAPGRIVPVHVCVIVSPIAVGTVTLPDGGVDADTAPASRKTAAIVPIAAIRKLNRAIE